MEKVRTTTRLIFHNLHLMGKVKHIFKSGAHINNVFIYINATFKYPSCLCSCLIVFFVWFSSVFHCSVDHPLGRTYPPHPVLCLHRQSKTTHRKSHNYLSYLITYSYCMWVSHDPPLCSVPRWVKMPDGTWRKGWCCTTQITMQVWAMHGTPYRER